MSAAKITREECMKVIPNQYNMALVVAQRARELELLSKKKNTFVKVPLTTAMEDVASGRIGEEYITKSFAAIQPPKKKD